MTWLLNLWTHYSSGYQYKTWARLGPSSKSRMTEVAAHRPHLFLRNYRQLMRATWYVVLSQVNNLPLMFMQVALIKYSGSPNQTQTWTKEPGIQKYKIKKQIKLAFLVLYVTSSNVLPSLPVLFHLAYSSFQIHWCCKWQTIFLFRLNNIPVHVLAHTSTHPPTHTQSFARLFWLPHIKFNLHIEVSKLTHEHSKLSPGATF